MKAVELRLANVRFTPERGHWSRVRACPLRRALRFAGDPGHLAAGATHGAPGRADRGLVDPVGGRAARTDDQHVIGAHLAPKPSSRPLMDWKPCPPGG